MELALSTRWNAHRHADGEALLQEVLELGFQRAELGYDLTLDLVPGVRRMVEQGAIRIGSVHNFCPVPVGAPAAHPELFQLAGLDTRMRELAVQHTRQTAEFAAELGARVVVVHAGNVEMRNLTRKLVHMAESGKQYTPKYDRTKTKLLMRRHKKVEKHLDALRGALDELLPTFEKCSVTLALEVLPSWEALPTESEMEALCQRYPSPALGWWYDVGHAKVRDNLGLVDSLRWVQRLSERIAGMHIHDVTPPAYDHMMPPRGTVDFAPFTPLVRSGIVQVLEPMPATPADEILEAVDALRLVWENGSEDGD